MRQFYRDFSASTGFVQVQADSLPDRSLALRYGLSYAALFFVMGVLGPFFSLFLSGQGFDAATIGFLLALGGPVRVFAGPLMGWVADAGVRLRWIMGAAQIGAGLCVAAMIGVTSTPLMAVMIAVLYALHGPLSSMVDASVSHVMARRATLNYARIRLWGSLAFIAGNLAGGFVADRSITGIAVLAATCLCLGAGLSFFLPQDRQSTSTGKPGIAAVQDTPARWGLIALFIAAAAAIQASHAAIYTISALAWRAQGLSQSMTGLLWTLGVVVEVVLFFRIGRTISGLRRAIIFIALGGGLAVVRWVIMATQPSLPLTMLCQLMHGLTFGATHLGLIAALTELSPSAFRSRIQGSSAAAHALTTSVAIYWTGGLFQAGGAQAAYQLMAAFAGAGLMFAMALFWRTLLRPAAT